MTKISKEKMEHWDYSENDISPEELTNGSHKKVNWICEEGHQWNTSVKDKGTCPYCLGRKVGYGNDLLTNFPNVKNIWDYSKNSKKPEDVLAQGRTKFYFKCNKYRKISFVKNMLSPQGCIGRSVFWHCLCVFTCFVSVPKSALTTSATVK